ncbi:MAG: transglycosylase domain-containing protein [Chitinophagaceae bacterium]|nr:transglycosylase domain-containing protein [Chitinophagaceae bacterium]
MGPNVYGIGEAARFYFNKQPSQLTLQESIFFSRELYPAPNILNTSLIKRVI